MKRNIFLVLLVMFCVISSSAFAAETTATALTGADKDITVGADGVGHDGVMTVGLTPKVCAQITVGPDATGAADQWYSIGTFHVGGADKVYATASNATRKYMITPTALGFGDMVTTAASEDDWVDVNGWEAL